MGLTVSIIPDKFKGTLTARQAASAIEAGWQAVRPGDDVHILPMSDGGDGFGEVMGGLLHATPQEFATVDASHHPCKSRWWLAKDQSLAIIESAEVIGLAMLEQGKFHPFELDTFGLGVLMTEAARQGAKRCIVGIGGSATNDGGIGMARAMGWAFQNHRGGLIERWTDLHTLHQVHPPDPIHPFDEITVAVDVQNPLVGPQGCSRIYGPQKGLRPEDFEFSERCLDTLAAVMKEQGYSEHRDTPGAGAAGGLGYGLLSFCGAKLQNGFELFARHTHLDDVIQRSDLVLTAEGGLDKQTIMGKGVGEIGLRCRKHQVPCLALAGKITDPDHARQLFQEVYSLTPDFTSVEKAMNEASISLEQLATAAARDFDLMPSSS